MKSNAVERLKELKESAIDEMVSYAEKKNGKMEMSDWEVIDTLAHSAKNLCKTIDALEGKSEMAYVGQYYNDGYSDRGSYMYPEAGRGRGSNANRDSMGRYSSHGDPSLDRLYDMMRTAPDERTRMAYQKAIDEMEGRRY